MSGAPWFAFYPSDWLAGTAGLSPAQRGIYITLVAMMYDGEKPLERNDRQLARHCGTSKTTFTQILDALISSRKIVVLDDGRLFNDRAKTELQARTKKVATAKENAAARWAKNDEKTTSDKCNGSHSASAIDVQNGCYLQPQPEIDKELPVRAERAASKQRKRTDYSAEFEDFWKGYPTDANMSKKDAFAEWLRLPADKQKAALASLPSFRAYCASHRDYRPVYAERYLKSERFDGHLAVHVKSSIERGVYVGAGTSQWDAWEQHYRRTKGVSPPRDDKGGWWFPSPWPPAIVEARQ